MQKISKTYLVVTIIVIGAVAWLLLSRPKNEPNVPHITQTPAATAPTDTAWPSQELEKKTVKDSNQYYRINASYPVTKDPRISDVLKSFVDDQIAQFKDDTSWAADPTAGPSAEASSLSLDIDYTESKSARADTYVFDIVTYTGGAHGLQVSRTFTFDQTGKTVSVADLFTNGEEGLKTISAFVQGELAKKAISDPKWIADGAGPKPENYQNFTISDAGVTFIFDPYQVAAYAAGGQNILVPLSVFRGIANPKLFAK